MNENQARWPRSVTFTVRAEPGSQVYVGGTFNDWKYLDSPLAEGPEEGVFVHVCAVEPGTHEYKFHIDGSWVLDPTNPNLRENAFGSLNNVLEVR